MTPKPTGEADYLPVSGKPMSRFERWYAQRTGRALVRLGKMAMKRGDVHEYRHAYAALMAGNSDPCVTGMCHLDLADLDRWLRENEASS